MKDVSHISKYDKQEMILVFEHNAEKFRKQLDKHLLKAKTKAIEREIDICNEHIEICLKTIELLS